MPTPKKLKAIKDFGTAAASTKDPAAFAKKMQALRNKEVEEQAKRKKKPKNRLGQ